MMVTMRGSRLLRDVSMTRRIRGEDSDKEEEAWTGTNSAFLSSELSSRLRQLLQSPP